MYDEKSRDLRKTDNDQCVEKVELLSTEKSDETSGEGESPAVVRMHDEKLMAVRQTDLVRMHDREPGDREIYIMANMCRRGEELIYKVWHKMKCTIDFSRME